MWRRALSGVSIIAFSAGLTGTAVASEAAPNLVDRLNLSADDISPVSSGAELQTPGESRIIETLEPPASDQLDPGSPSASRIVETLTAPNSDPSSLSDSRIVETLVPPDTEESLLLGSVATPANVREAPNLAQMLWEKGHDFSIHHLLPLMNWRDDLGPPTGQFDNTNTRPSVGQINMRRSDNNANMGYCSGTLINPRFFLTAAHCVRDGVTPDALVRAGINFAPSTGNVFTGAGTSQAVGIVTPALYDPFAFFLGQDLAIVALNRPVYNIVPSPIATSNTLGQTITEVGYGTAGQGSLPNQIFDFARRIGTNLHEGVYILSGSSTGTVIAADFEDPLNPLLTNTIGLFPTVTVREAAVAPGDSGGPIFDSFGRVLGVASGAITIGVGGWGYGSIPFWTNLTELQYQTFIAANDPLRFSNAVASGSWLAGGTWSGGIIPDNTFKFAHDPFALPNYAINQRFYNVAIGSGHAVTLGALAEIDQLAILGSSSLGIGAGGDLGFWGFSSVLGSLDVDGILRSFDFTFGVLGLGGTGILSGTGSIFAPVTVFGGSVRPGDSIGTLNIIGPYVQGPAGLLDIEVTNGAADLLNITGTASLDGTLRVSQFGAAPVAGQVNTILSASGGRTGTFSTLIDNIPGPLFPQVIYGPTFVDLRITSFCFDASGPVQTPVCQALETLTTGTTPAMLSAIGTLQLTDPLQMGRVLEALNPTRIHGQAIAALSFGDLLSDQLSRKGRVNDNHQPLLGFLSAPSMMHFASAEPSWDMLMPAAAAAEETGAAARLGPSDGWNLLLAADWVNVATDQPGAIGKDKADFGAVTAGFDRSAGENLVLGMAVSYLPGEIRQNYGFGGRTESQGFALSGYGNWRGENTHAYFLASAGLVQFDTDRTIFDGVNFVPVAGSTEATQIQTGVTLGHDFWRGDLIGLGGLGGLYYIGLDLDGYTETGSIFGAVVPDRSIESLKSSLGLEATWHVSPNDVFLPYMRVLWNYEFLDDSFVSSVAFAGDPTVSFTSPSPELGSHWATLGVGVSGEIGESSRVFFGYQGEVWREGQDQHSVSAGAKIGL